MSRIRKTQQRSTESTTQILAAARERFGKYGFDAVMIEAIAADCGRTKGAVYHHFASKEALFEAVYVMEQRRVAQLVVREPAATDLVLALQHGLTRYFELIATDSEAARITLIDAPAVLGWMKWRSCDDGPFRAILHASVRSIDASGRLRDGLEVDLLGELLLGAITEAACAIAVSGASAAAFAAALTRLVDHVTIAQS